MALEASGSPGILEVMSRLRNGLRSSGRLVSLYRGLRGFVFGVQPKRDSKVPSRIEDHVWQIREVTPRRSREAGYRLNLIIPTVNANATFGGVQTALDVFEAIGATDARRRIITLDVVDGSATELLSTYPLKTTIEDSSDPLQVVSVAESAGAALPIGPGMRS